MKTFVSFSQNFEDVIVNRYFDRAPGFYVDVGAGHPTLDSVTAGLSRIGWYGINIEPGKVNSRRLMSKRKRDITLAVAAGRNEGFAELESSADPHQATLKNFAPSSKSDVPRGKIPVRTLDSILDDLGPNLPRLDLVKIDVEGFEMEVLEGFDLDKWSPKLLLIEFLQGTKDSSSEIVEYLEERDYALVYQDGLNGFFVPRLDSAAAKTRLSVGPNFHDDFMLVNHWRLWRATLGPFRSWIRAQIISKFPR